MTSSPHPVQTGIEGRKYRTICDIEQSVSPVREKKKGFLLTKQIGGTGRKLWGNLLVGAKMLLAKNWTVIKKPTVANWAKSVQVELVNQIQTWQCER